MRTAAQTNAQQNLKPAKPGEVRNPTGRNQYQVHALIREVINESATKEKVQKVIDRVFKDAIGGNTAAQKILLDRLWPAHVKLDIDVDATEAAAPVIDAIFEKHATPEEKLRRAEIAQLEADVRRRAMKARK